jgi:serine/threonine-protein kinase
MAQENTNSFKDKLKAWGRFFISAYFIKNFCIWLASVLLFFIIVLVGLRVYTRHSQKVSVPSVEGMTIEQAQKIIQERKLEAVVSDSVYNSTAASGTVIPGGQTPRAGYLVKEGRKIFLTYKTWSREATEMPDLAGRSLVDCQEQLRLRGLLLGQVKKEKGPHNDLFKEARINGAKISKGKKLLKGDVIDLIMWEKDDKSDSGGTEPSTDEIPDAFIDEEF